MRCDHFDAIALGQLSIQAVTVVGFVADQSCKVPQVRARVLGANLGHPAVIVDDTAAVIVDDTAA